MSKKWLKIVILGGIIFVIAGVLGYLYLFAWNPERQKLAQINDRRITVAQFEREVNKVPAPYQDMLREDPKQYLEQLIVKELLLQEAKRTGLITDRATLTPEAEAAAMEKLLKKEVFEKIQVNPEEIQEILKQHKGPMDKKSKEEMTTLVENLIREAKGNEKMEEYLTSLRKKAQIEVVESRLQKIAAPSPSTNSGEEFQQAMKSGKPVLVDFGANNCAPCRQIRPILREMEKEYTGKAHILIIDVYKEKDLARQFKVQMIPTLIFFDKAGKEVFRHMGAWDKASIAGKLKEAGAA
jgi:thioredoxin 1